MLINIKIIFLHDISTDSLTRNKKFLFIDFINLRNNDKFLLNLLQ